MSTVPLPNRLPRAGIDPVDAEAAIALVAMAIHRPFRDETVVILLDELHRGLGITVVSGTTDPNDVVDVVERITDADEGRLGAVVVASVRPGLYEAGEGDVDRWLELSDVVDAAGAELLEWYVISATIEQPMISCPRDLLGEPPRWWNVDARWG